MNAKARYVRKTAPIYQDSHCLYCGSCYGICKGEARACRTTTCKACGTEQCMVNGLGRGQCGICYVGLLPGWSGTDRQCSYKNCHKDAIAHADGQNAYRCAEHMERGKWAGHIVKCLADRDKKFILKPDMDVPAL